MMASNEPVRCEKCKKAFRNLAIAVVDKFYHPECQLCDKCVTNLKWGGRNLCDQCGSTPKSGIKDVDKCFACQHPTTDQTTVRMLDRTYLSTCANCFKCRKPLDVDDQQRRIFYTLNNQPCCGLPCVLVKPVVQSSGPCVMREQ